MTSLHVICGLGPPQSKILATPMGVSETLIFAINKFFLKARYVPQIKRTVQFDVFF